MYKIKWQVIPLAVAAPRSQSRGRAYIMAGLAVHTNVDRIMKSERGSALNLPGHGLRIDLDVREVDGPSDAVPAARRQVRHADLVDFGEIRILDFGPRDDLLGIQLEPLHVVEGELDREEVTAGFNGVAADDVGAVLMVNRNTAAICGGVS